METNSPIKLLFSDVPEDWELCITLITKDQKTFNKYYLESVEFKNMQIFKFRHIDNEQRNTQCDKITDYLVDLLREGTSLFNKYRHAYYNQWKKKYGK